MTRSLSPDTSCSFVTYKTLLSSSSAVPLSDTSNWFNYDSPIEVVVRLLKSRSVMLSFECNMIEEGTLTFGLLALKVSCHSQRSE